MRTKIVMTVEVEIVTNDNETLLADIENEVSLHTKNCLMENPDFIDSVIEDVDVTIKKSAII